jgi:hypothetical protein
METLQETQAAAQPDTLPETQDTSQGDIREDELKKRIAEAAYFLAERRNFEPGHEIEDWLEAEAQVYAGLILAE